MVRDKFEPPVYVNQFHNHHRSDKENQRLANLPHTLDYLMRDDVLPRLLGKAQRSDRRVLDKLLEGGSIDHGGQRRRTEDIQDPKYRPGQQGGPGFIHFQRMFEGNYQVAHEKYKQNCCYHGVLCIKRLNLERNYRGSFKILQTI